MEYNSNAIHEAVEASRQPASFGSSPAMSMSSFKAAEDSGNQGSSGGQPVLILGLVCGLALITTRMKDTKKKETPPSYSAPSRAAETAATSVPVTQEALPTDETSDIEEGEVSSQAS